MIIEPYNRYYPIKPHSIHIKNDVRNPWRYLEKGNTFFTDVTHLRTISPESYYLWFFACGKRNWVDFDIAEIKKWIGEDKDMNPFTFDGRLIMPGNRPIHLLERFGERHFYYRHNFACEILRTTQKYNEEVCEYQGKIVSERIRPKHIDTSKAFKHMYGTPFSHDQIRIYARVLVSMFQYKDNLNYKKSGGRWFPFSQDEANKAMELSFGTNLMPIDDELIPLGFIKSVGNRLYAVTKRFILLCFQNSPESHFFVRIEDGKIIRKIRPAHV